MTRKDYRVIAFGLFASKPDEDDTLAYLQWEETIRKMCISLRYTNNMFDYDRFSNACHTGKD